MYTYIYFSDLYNTQYTNTSLLPLPPPISSPYSTIHLTHQTTATPKCCRSLRPFTSPKFP